MIPVIGGIAKIIQNIPRASGDDPVQLITSYSHGRYSPRERG